MKISKVTVLILAIGLLAFVTSSVAQQAQHIPTLICHIPPGNPANAHEITVDDDAVPAHLAHGDNRGACTVCQGGNDDRPCPTTTTR